MIWNAKMSVRISIIRNHKSKKSSMSCKKELINRINKYCNE